MLHWRKRFSEWSRHVRSIQGRVPWSKMLLAVSTGSVPAPVWRSRIRTCLRCPIYDRTKRVCYMPGPLDQYMLGCNCYVPFKALAAAPYAEGCYARHIGVMGEGWPAYVRPALGLRVQSWIAQLWRLR